MHELAVTESIIKICEEEAEKHGFKKIKEIRIKVGELTGLMPVCIQDYFNIITDGTKLQGAELKMEIIPMKVLCKNCNNTWEASLRDFKCPICNSTDIKIIGGNEFLIDSLEVE